MTTFEQKLEIRRDATDEMFIRGMREGDNAVTRKFFHVEIAGILHRIRTEVYQGRIEFDDMVSELYLYLSANNWAKLDGFNATNGCRLRSWMIPVAWRFFLGRREKFAALSDVTDSSEEMPEPTFGIDEGLRLQIVMDVETTLARMPNRRYVEVIRLLLIEGFEAEEVARILDVRVENVYNLKHRAIRQFIEYYGK